MKYSVDPAKVPSCALPLELKFLPAEMYKELFEVLYRSEKWEETMARRKRLFESASKPGANVTTVRKGVEQQDRKIADMLLHALQIQSCQIEKEPPVGINEMWAQIPADDKEKQALKLKCSYALNTIVFLSDVIESKLTDVEEYLKELFPGDNYHFVQFNGVKIALDQLFTALGHARSSNSQEEQELYEEYADSITEFVNKRMKTFIPKYKKLEIPNKK